ncbi:MAG: tetratricopeptide repeat protein [Actinomycetales bacterium]|nr:tetratricopeptide repeat protein [Actinomycetales bacterium]
MSQQSQPPQSFEMRGAVDLSGLARSAGPAPGEPGGIPAPGPYVVDADTASFGDLVQASTQYPVLVVLWAQWSEVATSLVRDLGTLAGESGGTFLLARIDAEANPQVAQAFRAQSVPTTVALMAGQPLPLFEGGLPLDQLRGLVDQVAQAATANGLTGRAPAGPGEAPTEAVEPEEPPLPPLHHEAYDAIERDDLPAAVAAYEKALAENPRDADAKAGLAQVRLLERLRGVDPHAVRRAAADAPEDIDAQLAVADLDVATGAVEDGFARVIDLVRVRFGEDRDRLREHLLELFEFVGSDDERVVAARRALAAALY